MPALCDALLDPPVFWGAPSRGGRQEPEGLKRSQHFSKTLFWMFFGRRAGANGEIRTDLCVSLCVVIR